MGDGFAGVSHSAVSKANERFSAKVKKNETLGKPRTEFQTRYPMARVPPHVLYGWRPAVFFVIIGLWMILLPGEN